MLEVTELHNWYHITERSHSRPEWILSLNERVPKKKHSTEIHYDKQSET